MYFSVDGNTIQIYLHEGAMRSPVPATRLSDGMMRYLMLLAILCHPSLPPLISLEEPEVGLHPDIIPDLAELLVEASTRTQLFVTTHSDHLVDCLSDCPEVVMVTEKTDLGTRFERLSKPSLKEWLERYTLGELWRKGELGGNRW
jgi:predicted ATPase